MASTSEAEALVIVDYLTKFVAENLNLIQNKDRVEKLCVELERLQLTMKQNQANIQEKLVMRSIRAQLHQAEDAIETYIFQELKRKAATPLLRSLDAVIFKDRILYRQIYEASTHLATISEKFHLLGQLQFTRKRDQRWEDKTLFLGDEDMVGCEDQVNKVIDLLTKDSDNLEVISITGMAGLGKTTLARKVFNHRAVDYRFYIRAFVSITQEYNRKTVYFDLCKQLGSSQYEEISKLDEPELVRFIHDYLQNRRFLIVLDDVCWNTQAWDDIKVALPKRNGEHNRVLITTENKCVASFVCKSMENQLDLRFLNWEESRHLLRREVFGENDCPRELEEYESKILKKCEGLPLAIISFARTLAKRGKKFDWWKKVAEDVNIFKEESRINKAIRASFNQLHSSLKLCFLYLGVFGENVEIPVWILLRLWVAEGLIQEANDDSLEYVAEEYLEELVDRNLVMVVSRRSNGRIKTCCVHGILLDFCRAEAKEENLYRESFFSEYCRRFCIRSSVSKFYKSMSKTNSLRSLLCFSDISSPRPEHILSALRTFKLLRVLDVRPIKLSHLPVELFSLFILRYIAISCGIAVLPEEFSNLCNLQTLIIETLSRANEICADISKMTLLRHLHINEPISFRKVKGMSGSVNENLQTLSIISAQSCTKEFLEKTPMLKKLGIRGKLATLMESGSNPNSFLCLRELLVHLENLKLLNDDKTCKFTLPYENNFPEKLTSLTLSNIFLDSRNMTELGKLENLEKLKLKDSEFEEKFWSTEDGGFRRLRVLNIEKTNLVRWEASGSNFPGLNSLFLRHCTKLEVLPHGLADMPCLQTVDIYRSHPILASTAREILLPKLESQSGFELSINPPDQ